MEKFWDKFRQVSELSGSTGARFGQKPTISEYLVALKDSLLNAKIQPYQVDNIILFTKRWEVNLHFDGIHASVVAQRIWGNVAYTYDWRFEKRGLAPARGWRFKQSGKRFEGRNLPGTAFLGEIGFRIWEKFIGFQRSL